MKRSVLSMMLVAGLLVVSPVWGAGLWLYEMGTPDLGTAAAGRAAMASDASTKMRDESTLSASRRRSSPPVVCSSGGSTLTDGTFDGRA